MPVSNPIGRSDAGGSGNFGDQILHDALWAVIVWVAEVKRLPICLHSHHHLIVI